MKLVRPLLALIVATGLLAGCSHIGESTAPKPDPSQFLPKGSTAGGPPPSSPTGK